MFLSLHGTLTQLLNAWGTQGLWLSLSGNIPLLEEGITWTLRFWNLNQQPWRSGLSFMQMDFSHPYWAICSMSVMLSGRGASFISFMQRLNQHPRPTIIWILPAYPTLFFLLCSTDSLSGRQIFLLSSLVTLHYSRLSHLLKCSSSSSCESGSSRHLWSPITSTSFLLSISVPLSLPLSSELTSVSIPLRAFEFLLWCRLFHSPSLCFLFSFLSHSLSVLSLFLLLLSPHLPSLHQLF